MIPTWLGHFLLLVLFSAAVYLGYVGYPIITILILAPVGFALYFLPIPVALSIGWTDHGLRYVLTTLFAWILICAIPFFVGRLAAMMF